MKNLVAIILFLCASVSALGQDSELAVFNNLIDKTWKAKGNWGDGSEFEQEILFEYDLEKTIVTAN